MLHLPLRPRETIQYRSNLELTFRERGKIVARRVGHNIWLTTGREYMARLIAYTSYAPLTPEEDSRVRYIGLGIGGDAQNASTVNDFPLGPVGAPGGIPNGYYPGTNVQNDSTLSVSGLERPVRVTGDAITPSEPPGYAGDPTELWMGAVVAPAAHPTATSTRFVRVFSEAEISYGPFLSVPLSEAGLFAASADPALPHQAPLAYDTFDSISKTAAFSLEVRWTVRF